MSTDVVLAFATKILWVILVFVGGLYGSKLLAGLTRRAMERARIDMELQVESLEIKRRETIQIGEQVREIAVSMKSKERSEAQAEAESARAAMVEAQERVQTIRDTEIANRQKAVELIEAQRVAQAEAEKTRILAEAEKAAAQDRADADRIAVAALEERLRVEAAGKEKLNAAENLRSDASRKSSLHKALVENLPSIIRESVKPMEKIEGIKIMHVEGLPGLSGPASATAGPDGGPAHDGNLAEQVVSSALRYRTQAPFVDTLLGEIGLSGDTVHRAHTLSDLSKIVYTEPSAPEKNRGRDKPRAN